MPIKLEMLKAPEGRELAKMKFQFSSPQEPNRKHSMSLHQDDNGNWNPVLGVDLEGCADPSVVTTLGHIASRLIEAAYCLQAADACKLEEAAYMLR